MDNLNRIFADNLRRERRRAGLSQKELSDALHYTEKAVSKWENGISIPPAETLCRLATILQTGIDELLSFSPEPEFFLGIDGGGTKTFFALADKSGQVLRSICLGPCNPVDIGFPKAEAIFTSGLEYCCKGISYAKVSLFGGISGGNVGSNQQILQDFFHKFHLNRVELGNDARSLIAAGLGKNDGLTMIIGTGSIVYAQKDGELSQFGGFGYLFDRSGNGYAMGRDAVFAAFADEDHSGPSTILTKKIAERCGVTATRNLTHFYDEGKSYIASFSDLVPQAYREGDRVAARILEKNVSEIARYLDVAACRFAPDQPLPVILAGGLTHEKDLLFPMIEAKLTHKNLQLMTYPYEPVLGALLLAGAPVKTDWDNHLKR